MCDTELTVSYPLTISLQVDGWDFNRVVEAVQTAAKRASDQLLGLALREIERRARQQAPGRWVNRGQGKRRLRVPWGEVTVRRTRVRDRRTGKTYYLADRLLGLRRYVRRGLHEVRLACELAVSMSYRLAHHWWQRLTGRQCSRMNFWRMVQEGGRRLVRREVDDVGEVRTEDPPPRAVRRLYLEADGAWLRRQRPRRAKRSAWGASPCSPRTGPRGFLLYVGASYDGDDGLSRVPGRYFKRALVQLDRFHVHRQLGRAFGLGTRGYRTALSALCAGDLGRVRSLLALRGIGDRRGTCQEVRAYLDRHEKTLYTYREWERRTTVRKMGSGVIEKTIDTHVSRRMKKQGMSWSAKGARHIAKLRALSWNRDRWNAFWSEQPT
jgi:hypothetical protein